jgi:hypothetical protein
MHSTKIASVNINGISTQTRVGMLRNFIHHHELEFVFFQEVTDPAILTVTGYIIYLNIRANMRATALLEGTRLFLYKRHIPTHGTSFRLRLKRPPPGKCVRTCRHGKKN